MKAAIIRKFTEDQLGLSFKSAKTRTFKFITTLLFLVLFFGLVLLTFSQAISSNPVTYINTTAEDFGKQDSVYVLILLQDHQEIFSQSLVSIFGSGKYSDLTDAIVTLNYEQRPYEGLSFLSEFRFFGDTIQYPFDSATSVSKLFILKDKVELPLAFQIQVPAGEFLYDIQYSDSVLTIKLTRNSFVKITASVLLSCTWLFCILVFLISLKIDTLILSAIIIAAVPLLRTLPSNIPQINVFDVAGYIWCEVLAVFSFTISAFRLFFSKSTASSDELPTMLNPLKEASSVEVNDNVSKTPQKNPDTSLKFEPDMI